MGLGKLLLNLIFGKGSYEKVKSDVERDMKNSPFFNEMKRRAEIVESEEFKAYRQSLREEEQREREKLSQEELISLKDKHIESSKKEILKLSRKKVKRSIEWLSLPALIEYQRNYKDYLVRHPELKTNQPKFYNKILMMCDVAEELKIREKKDSQD